MDIFRFLFDKGYKVAVLSGKNSVSSVKVWAK